MFFKFDGSVAEEQRSDRTAAKLNGGKNVQTSSAVMRISCRCNSGACGALNVSGIGTCR